MIAELQWSASPIRPIEAWPQSLRTGAHRGRGLAMIDTIARDAVRDMASSGTCVSFALPAAPVRRRIPAEAAGGARSATM
jgi:hypothetical protein